MACSSAVASGRGPRAYAARCYSDSQRPRARRAARRRPALGQQRRRRQSSLRTARATGLVDEIDVLSWLTADVLGRPLLHADDTNAVGKRIAAHASRVEKRLRVETESTRNTVGKARVVAAKKSPSCCPRWPQLKRRAKRHVPCCSRSRTTRSCQPRLSARSGRRRTGGSARWTRPVPRRREAGQRYYDQL